MLTLNCLDRCGLIARPPFYHKPPPQPQQRLITTATTLSTWELANLDGLDERRVDVIPNEYMTRVQCRQHPGLCRMNVDAFDAIGCGRERFLWTSAN